MVVISAREILKGDRQIEKELSEAKLRRFMARASLLRGQVTPPEFSALKEEVQRMEQILSLHHTTISDHEKRIVFLEAQSKKIEYVNNLRVISDNNVKLVRGLLNLPEITARRTDENVLAEMKGMLEEYSDEETDSVELLRSMRGE